MPEPNPAVVQARTDVVVAANFPAWASSDGMIVDMLARDSALGTDHRRLNVDQLDRRILLEKLAGAYQELDEALGRLESGRMHDHDGTERGS